MQYSQMVRKVGLSVLCVIGFGLMTGCAHDFVRPAPEAVKLGKSHSEDVIKAVSGSPFRHNNVVVNNEKIDVISYLYTGNVSFWGAIIPQHMLTYSFYNDVLIGEELNSTFDGEKTEFDTGKVSQIRKGQTREQVIGILGTPSGRILYPLITDKTGSGLVYAYAYSRFAPVVSPSWSYLLIITFNENNVVTNISYKENNKEMIAQSGN